jgi:hypothetical protein
MKLSYQEVEELANQYGLVIRGGFEVEQGDDVPEFSQGKLAKTLVLFGNAGSSIWREFSNSPEYADNKTDPLNRWSGRIGNEMALTLGGQAYFPFGEPPYRPFIKWAKKSETLTPSKLGMLIHPKYGLWHAYRFAITFDSKLSLPGSQTVSEDICSNCVEQPCLNQCPVGAFTGKDYDVESCYHFLKATPAASCHTHTCMARLACPEGAKFNYHLDHAQFHMKAFYNSIANRFEDQNH